MEAVAIGIPKAVFSNDTRPDVVICTNLCVEITKNDKSVITWDSLQSCTEAAVE